LPYLGALCAPSGACVGDYVDAALAWMDFYAAALDDPNRAELDPLRRFDPDDIQPTAMSDLLEPTLPPDVPGDTAGPRRDQPAAASGDASEPVFEQPIVDSDVVTVTRSEDGLEIGLNVESPTTDDGAASTAQSAGQTGGARGRTDGDRRGRR
jgi:hypothetical protein